MACLYNFRRPTLFLPARVSRKITVWTKCYYEYVYLAVWFTLSPVASPATWWYLLFIMRSRDFHHFVNASVALSLIVRVIKGILFMGIQVLYAIVLQNSTQRCPLSMKCPLFSHEGLQYILFSRFFLLSRSSFTPPPPLFLSIFFVVFFPSSHLSLFVLFSFAFFGL